MQTGRLDFKCLYNDKASSDTILVVNSGAVAIWVHKDLLRAASAHFAEALTENADTINVDAPLYGDAVTVIRWIYGFNIDITDNAVWLRLWKLASVLRMPDLVDALIAQCQVPPSELIRCGYEHMSPDLVDVGIRVLMNTGVENYGPHIDGIIALGFESYGVICQRWIEGGLDIFMLLHLVCAANVKLCDSQGASRDALAAMMVTVDFRKFTPRQRELAAGFPVIRDWDMARRMIAMAEPL
jgi:hypothetical protein